MRRLAIGIFLLGIAAAAASLETYTRPEIFETALVPPNMTVDKTGASLIVISENVPVQTPPKQTEQPDIVEEKVVSENYFSVASLKALHVTLGQGKYAASLFRHVPVDVNKDSFSLVLFPFSIDGKAVGTVSRIIPAEEMSSGRLLALVRKKLETVAAPESDTETSDLTITKPLKTIGEANFYLNDRGRFPDTVFLVARSEGKVLAFQYSSEYHEQVKKVISLFFQ